MSGIVGIFYLDDRPVDGADLERMVSSLAHRGPDASGSWFKEGVGLGHRMLWTTPESRLEDAPLVNRSGDVVLTADARIDNREELAAALKFRDGSGVEITDGQLILAAYEKWGADCPKKLLGDFAFAIWDGRKQALFCARDPIGIKPLYYYASKQLFAFASEIKALLCLADVPRQLNTVRVADHLVTLLEDTEITFYRDILRLPAAHCLAVEREGMHSRRYWSLNASREIHLPSDSAYADAFREILTKAVSCRLRSAYPIGTMLSGGLDSSSIACTARDLLAGRGAQNLHTFSAIFPNLPEADLRTLDERKYIDHILAQGGFEPHYVHADRLSPLVDLERVMQHQDEAFLAPNLYMHWGLYGSAQEAGVRVLLDGIDGDTTVSHGLEYLSDLARTFRWPTLVSEATALAQTSNNFYTSRRIIWEYALKPLAPESIVQVWRALRGRKQPKWADGSVVKPSFADRIGIEKRARALSYNDKPLRNAREQHRHSLSSGMIPYALELLDKAATAFALEPRYPFFDRRLIEFCVALPPQQKLHQGWTRAVMHRAMEGILPPEVQWRFTKANLTPNFQRRLLDCERKRIEALLNESAAIEAYVDVPALRSTYQLYASRPLQSEKEALAVYGAVILARWLEKSGLTA